MLCDNQAIYAQISPNIKPNADEPGTYGIPCSELTSLSAEISFAFKSESGSTFDLKIPSSELSVGPFRNKPELCQTLINAQEFFTVIGGSAFKHYYTVWDLGNKRLGFASNGEHRVYDEWRLSLLTPSPQVFSWLSVAKTVHIIIRLVNNYVVNAALTTFTHS